MGEADCLDGIGRAVRGAAKSADRDFLSPIKRMVLRDGFGRIDGEESRLAAVDGCGSDGFRRDPAVDGAGGEIGVGPAVADSLIGLADGKLHDLDLGGVYAVLTQDHLEYGGIGLAAADDADRASGQLGNFFTGSPAVLRPLAIMALDGANSTTTFLCSVATAWALRGQV